MISDSELKPFRFEKDAQSTKAYMINRYMEDNNCSRERAEADFAAIAKGVT